MTYMKIAAPAHYSDGAYRAFEQLDGMVDDVFAQIRRWRGWVYIHNPETSRENIIRFISEIFRSVVMYQKHTTEAGFHMFGRLPKHEVRLIQSLCSHKAEEAEHGLWAKEDFGKLGGEEGVSEHPSPATFAVAAVWWRLAIAEEPLGYLGAEYLFEELTARVTAALLPLIERRNLPREGFRFVIEHATEDAKHAVFIKHLILDVVTRYPESANAMYRCFRHFNHVYPLQVWDEALDRAVPTKPFTNTLFGEYPILSDLSAG